MLDAGVVLAPKTATFTVLFLFFLGGATAPVVKELPDKIITFYRYLQFYKGEIFK